MGLVYQVYDEEMGRDVALKTLTRLDSDQLFRLKEEFRSHRGIVHDNLVENYELVVDEEWCFFTMELVLGVDFIAHVWGEPSVDRTYTLSAMGSAMDASTFQWTTGGAPESLAGSEWTARELTPEVIARLGEATWQLVLGVSALHRAGKLHRDIKPSNVLVTGAGRVVLLDFGLVIPIRPVGLEDADRAEIVGTIPYMAPEQMWSRPNSPASDWYSVGVMLYQALTGRLPFDGSFATMLCDKERRNTLPPSAFVNSPPAALNDLVMHLLHPEPGHRAGADEILRALRDTGTRAPVGHVELSASGTAPFVGRAEEIEILRSAFEGLHSGRRSVIRIEGASGMGKTELVRRFLASIRSSRDTLVLEGRCHPLESVPYKAFDPIVDALSGFLRRRRSAEVAQLAPRHTAALLRLFPVLDRVPDFAKAVESSQTLEPQELRRHGFEAMCELLSNVARTRRVVVWIDDLQWGDLDSGLLLLELLRHAVSFPILLLLSYRSEDIGHSPFLDALLATIDELPPGTAARVAVGPLASALARELTATLLESVGSTPSATIAEIVTDADGSPFFISELTRHLSYARPRGASGLPTLPRFASMLKDRLDRLKDNELQILEIVAIAGGPLARSVALHAAGVGEAGRTDVMRLEQACLLRSTERNGQPAVEAYHDRIREALVAQLPSDRRRACHRRLAEALRATPNADPEALVEHYRGAGDAAWAGHYAVLAAQQAAEALAFDQAARMYGLAVELHAGDPEQWRLRSKLAEALVNTGRGGPAAESFVAAARDLSERSPGDPRVLELRRYAAEHYLRSGHIDDGVAMLRTVLATVGIEYPASPQRALISVLAQRARLWWRGLDFQARDLDEIPNETLLRMDACWSAGLGLAWVDQIRTAAFQARYMQMALDSGERSRVARALSTEASQLACLGGASRRRRSDRVMEKATRLADVTGEPSVIAFTILMRGSIAFYGAQWRRSLELCRSAEDLLRERCRGTTWEMTTSHLLSVGALVYLGEIKELVSSLPLLLRAAHERGDILAGASLASGLPNMAWLAGDQPDEARRQADHAMTGWPQTDFQAQHYFDLLARTQIDLYAGDAWAALQRITAAWPRLRASVNLRVQNFRVTLRHLRARCALAAAAPGSGPRPRALRGWNRDRLLQLALWDARRLDGEGQPWASAFVALLRGSIAAIQAREGVAVEQLDRAASAFSRIDMALYAAAARCQGGLLRGGDEGRARLTAGEVWMRGQGIVAPARIAAMLVPGLRP